MKRLLGIVALSAFPGPSDAVVIHVLPDGSGDAPTIAAALVIAAPNDVISLGPGTFYEHDLVWKSQVGLVSDTGDPSTTFIDAQGLGRCVDFSNKVRIPLSTVTGISFTNGTTSGVGGLLKVDNTNFRFVNCAFRGGSAANGGAAGSTPGQFYVNGPSFADCVFEDNSATSLGGALCSSESFDRGIAPNRCQFRGNTASSGGAIYTEKRDFQDGIGIEDCVFEDNVATASGGAIFSTGNQHESDDTGTCIRYCTFRGNRARDGGALHMSQFDDADQCVFLQNAATNAGGAIYALAVRPGVEGTGGEIRSNLFARNAAAQGGALVLAGGGPYFVSNTFALNEAPYGAHLVFQGAISPYSMSNCILAFGVGGDPAAGTPTAVRCFDVYGHKDGDWVGPLAGQLGVNGNISADPQFCDIASDNYTLAEGSPCLQPCPGGGGRYGRYGLGCGPVAVESSTWGEIKGLFAAPK